MEAVVQALLQSPKATLYFKEIGDALQRESARRAQYHEQITEGEKSEFINGKVFVHSPVRLSHNDVSFRLALLLRQFVIFRQLGHVGHEKLMVSLTRNDYEPDICYWNRSKFASFESRQLQFPAPDFIAEVLSDSTEQIDRGIKFEDYAAHGVSEYWIIDPDKQIVEQYVLANGEYSLATKSSTGTVASPAVDGFTIPVRAIFDDAENLATLRRLII